MKKTIKILILLTVVSCSNQQTEITNQSVFSDSTSVNDSLVVSTDTIPKCEPSENFMALIKYMDSCSYHIDTATISKTARQFDNIKLNQESYSTTFIHALLKDSAVYAGRSRSLVSVSYAAKYDLNFERANCIWSYSWRIPDTESGLKRRGTVEEWIFESDSSAKFAYDFLIKEGEYMGFPYCKTPAFYLQCNQYLYLFHSDNSGVGYRNKPFYQWLTKKCIST